MIDGIDGSGKSTLVSAIRDTLAARGKKVFDLVQFQRHHRVNPSLVTLEGYDVIVSGEPSYCLIGAAIRNHIIRTNTPFPGPSIAQAYALDREVHYRELVIPALDAGLTIVQDRGVSTTLCYQPLQDRPVPVQTILALEGNRLALLRRPDVLLLAACRATEAIRRLGERSGKKDNSIFERGDFLNRAAQRFSSPEFRRLFTDRGTEVLELDTNPPLAEVRASIENLIPSLLAL